MALDEGTQPARKKKRKRVVVDRPKVGYRTSDSGEAAKFTRSKAYRKTRRRTYRTSDSGEAAAFTADQRTRRARAATATLPRLETYTGPGPTPGQAAKSRADAIAAQALRAIAPEVQQSAISAPGARTSGESFLSGLIGPNITALLPIRDGTPASEATLSGVGVDLAMTAPIFKGPRALFRGAQAAREGADTGAAARVAKESFSEPVFRRPKGRSVGEKAMTHRIPGAGSAAGRVAERFSDEILRPVASKATFGAVKSRSAKGGDEFGRSQRLQTKIDQAPALALERTVRGKLGIGRLRPAQLYALRLVAEGADPVKRMAMHSDQAKKATKPLDVAVQGVHVDLIRSAVRYVIPDPNGGLKLAPNAPGKLKSAWRQLEKVAGGREEILKSVGRLVDEEIAHRVQAPGRVVEGARFLSKPLADKLADADDVAQLAESFVGKYVRAGDRGNIGRIMSVDLAAGTARVAFRNRTTKRRAEAELDLNDLTFDRDPEARLVGAEDYDAGKIRVPYERAIPLPAVTGLPRFVSRASGAYMRSVGSLFGGGRRRAIGGGPDLKALRKAYEGKALLSGYFDIDVATTTAQDLVKASRLGAAHRARAALIEGAADVPTRVDDVAIKVDPEQKMPEELKKLWDRLERAAEGKRMRNADLQQIDLSLTEALREDVFPAEIDGMSVYEAAEHLLKDEIGPIDNIRWVNREFLENSELLNIPKAAKLLQRGWGKQARAVSGGVWLTMDALNDVQKAAILYLNPAYIPANLVGNLVMNLFQQGPFMLVNLPKAAAFHWKLKPEETALIDSLMGHGLVGSAELRLGPKAATSGLARGIGALVDTVPRRAAFLHEARKAGARSFKDLRRMLGDGSEEGRALLEDVARKGNDAIIDYERLSPFERDYVTRIIFFYPWIKGATRYTLRFPLEHPYQAAAYAALGHEQQQRADDDLGERPWFAQFAQKIGEREVPGEGTLPLTTNLRQALPFSTPIELAQTAKGFATGDVEAPQLVENLVPSLYGAGRALFGYDPYTRQEVDPGAGSFVRGLYEELPQKRLYEAFTMTDEERARRNENALYPRSRTDDILRGFFGGLTPTPYNPRVAAERREETRRENLEPEERRMEDLKARVDHARKAFKAGGRKFPTEYRKLAERRVMVTEAEEEIKEATGAKKLTESQRVASLLAVASETKELRDYHDRFAVLYQDAQGHPLDQGEHPNGPMRELYNALYRLLGFQTLSRYDEIVRAMEDERQVQDG